MTAVLVLSCDGSWDDGRMPCRGALPLGTVGVGQGRYEAARQGWTSNARAFAPRDFRPVDLCPACSRRELEGRR
jgi:hypothetical protein